MSQVNTYGMTLLNSAFNKICEDYLMKNMENINTYSLFLNQSKSEIIDVLKRVFNNGPVKYNLKLEAIYIIPGTNKVENRTFKTSARLIYMETDLSDNLEEDFINRTRIIKGPRVWLYTR